MAHRIEKLKNKKLNKVKDLMFFNRCESVDSLIVGIKSEKVSKTFQILEKSVKNGTGLSLTNSGKWKQ